MIALIQNTLPFLVVLFHVALGVLLVSLLMRNSLSLWVGKYALNLGFLTALVGVVGSLFYSVLLGFVPCSLCWWQRIALFPLLPLMTTAVLKEDRGVFKYVLPLSVIGLLISIYHSYIQWGGSPLIPCDIGGSCSKLYVYAFGYITIPTMSMTIAAAMLLLYWANRIYENRHA